MLAQYHQLAAKVDAFFGRVAARYPTEVTCAAGCDRCCHVRLTITAIEAAAIRDWAAETSDEELRELAHAAQRSDPTIARCAALDDAGRCRIYAARPLVCRSHGLPIRQKDHRQLPVIHSCELTFQTIAATAAAPDCMLDQELVSTTLGLIDRAYAAALRHSTERVELADVLVQLATAPP